MNLQANANGLCVRQIVEAMNQDSGVGLTQLQADGGMTANQLLMQLQADILHIPIGENTPPDSAQLIILCCCLLSRSIPGAAPR